MQRAINREPSPALFPLDGCAAVWASFASMVELDAEGTAAEAQVTGALARLGLLHGDETPGFTRLGGGVSSDIWRIDLVRGPVCVKRALPKLRVEQDWFAPVERNAYEAAWMRFAAAV